MIKTGKYRIKCRECKFFDTTNLVGLGYCSKRNSNVDYHGTRCDLFEKDINWGKKMIDSERRLQELQK
ncbi:hypothetical protein LCGC14_2485070 [marine sediment metagenome]|uniref:Uncharacterized protein n=1 Tax=marine sediment metagenome TaxID=412755 RepID=A0A0F9B764_9ZZZZ